MDLCAPALIYLIFSLTHIVIDTLKGLYNTAFMKFIVMILITILLNALCRNGMSVVSWLIVFIPFIFMTFIVALLLMFFGLDPATGNYVVQCSGPECPPPLQPNTCQTLTPNATTTPPNPSDTDITGTTTTTPAPNKIPPFWTTDPTYESFRNRGDN